MAGENTEGGFRPNAAELRARRRRSLAIGATLVALVVIFYVMTLFKFAGQGGWPG